MRSYRSGFGGESSRACQELGITDWPKIVRQGLTEEQKIEHALTLTMARRQLTGEQKKEIAVKLRQRGWTQERIARALGVDHRTIGRWLQDVGKTANVAPESATPSLPKTVTDTLGRKQPASKPRKR